MTLLIVFVVALAVLGVAQGVAVGLGLIILGVFGAAGGTVRRIIVALAEYRRWELAFPPPRERKVSNRFYWGVPPGPYPGWHDTIPHDDGADCWCSPTVARECPDCGPLLDPPAFCPTCGGYGSIPSEPSHPHAYVVHRLGQGAA